MKCPKGYIKRSGYTRKTKTGKTVKVKAACILSRGEKPVKRTDIDKKIMKNLEKIHTKARQMFGTPTCKKGEILREGYKKKSYVTKKGVKVNEVWVKPVCIKSPTGKPKGKKLFVLEKKGLSEFGYKDITNLPSAKRHSILLEALRNKNPLSVYRRLVALSLLNKNKNPKLSQLLKKDSDWVKTTKEYIANMATVSPKKKSPKIKTSKTKISKTKTSKRKSPKQKTSKAKISKTKISKIKTSKRKSPNQKSSKTKTSTRKIFKKRSPKNL